MKTCYAYRVRHVAHRLLDALDVGRIWTPGCLASFPCLQRSTTAAIVVYLRGAVDCCGSKWIKVNTAPLQWTQAGYTGDPNSKCCKSFNLIRHVQHMPCKDAFRTGLHRAILERRWQGVCKDPGRAVCRRWIYNRQRCHGATVQVLIGITAVSLGFTGHFFVSLLFFAHI